MEASRYDNSEYAYSEVFWGKDKNRDYEHRADMLAISSDVKGTSEWIADLGGGFGRLVPILKAKSKNIILVDASLDLLQEATETYGDDPTIYYIRANLYHMPFKKLALERAVCYRVMHHIDEVDIFFEEMNRVIGGRLYLEFPNKKHLLQRIRSLRGDRSINVEDEKPELRDGMFLNFSLLFIKSRILRKTLFFVEKVKGVSFLRHKLLKKFPLKIMDAVENILQHTPYVAEFAPSIFLSLVKPNYKENSYSAIIDMLQCPVCGDTFEVAKTSLVCARDHHYPIQGNILDLYVE